MSEATPRRLQPGWTEVALVCRKCHKRGSGPKKLKGREVSQALRSALKHRPTRCRVVATDCLGLCPKRAVAVVLPTSTAEAAVFAIADVDEVASAVASAGERAG